MYRTQSSVEEFFTVYIHSLSGGLRQPSGVCWRTPGPGVMGSGMCPTELPCRLRQVVRVPALDSRRSGSQRLKKVFPPHFIQLAFLLPSPTKSPLIPIFSSHFYFSFFLWCLVSFDVFLLTHPDSTHMWQNIKIPK